MLKALELVGFKSFADKTRFAFRPGVTVIVGPNGSGKSNIVDAIKWVLGAQSVKSLRGQEMADVIFNGSGSRRPLNTAETTLTFDNSSQLLRIDTPEVHVTRRIYRSGEGEYLINHQPCRLRDIRDLFAGTGIATEAYSVIEQGKVDVLLQSSPRDRRVIFEEAAGISRFKAKKLEASRRLERVEQNMLRLSDIVEEVESRLRTIRSQATKARRYKQYTDRLQELRTQVGMADWRAISEQIATLEKELESLRQERDEAHAHLEAMEAAALELETEAAAQDETIRRIEAAGAHQRERIAAMETTIENERGRSCDLEAEAGRHRRQLAALQVRAGDLDQQLRDTAAALREADADDAELRGRVEHDQQALAKLNEELARLRQDNQCRRDEQMEKMRTASELGNRISVLKSQRAGAKEARDRCQKQLSELQSRCDKLRDELKKARDHQQTADEAHRDCAERLDAGQQELAQLRRDLTRHQKELGQLQGRHTGAQQRKVVLEDLERRLEGLSAGVKQVLVKAQQAGGSGPWRQMCGLVADLFHVSVETAPIIEVALGERAQYLVVSPGEEFLDFLTTESTQFDGRVGFLRMDVAAPASPVDRINLEGRPGVVGRADQFVETTAQFLPLVRRLLGRVWVVEKLAHALQLSESTGRGLTFVTLSGELVQPDGTIAVGPRQSSTGLISRRSELRALKQQIVELADKVAEREATVAEVESRIAESDQNVHDLSLENQRLADALSECRLHTASCEDRLEQLTAQRNTVEEEWQAVSKLHQSSSDELEQSGGRLVELETQIDQLASQIESDVARIQAVEADRSERQEQTTVAQVELATSQQRLAGLRTQWQQLERDQQERNRALEEGHAQLAQCLARLEESSRDTLAAESEVAELYLRKEQLAEESAAAMARLDELRTRRASSATQMQTVRGQLRSGDKQVHEKELAASQLYHQRDTLAERLRDDYDIDIQQLINNQQHADVSAEEIHQREEVEQEIADLRRKINNIGNVNLEALGELEELDTRYASLSAQFDDLTKAKNSLEQIIARINADSRRMFSETLETVRGHFQELFRKLFGGGHADIVLDEQQDADILESGIEIVARPPGKEPRSISLLSGGEKTLTCVALLLAIFRSRPSPFCVLDEVDAALDEANIERFTGVITEFLSSTQFLVVTHSKKTMTAANTLYGVTMQESGVSKRVSVRFDDVTEDGHIRTSAIRSSLVEEASPDDDDTQAA